MRCPDLPLLWVLVRFLKPAMQSCLPTVYKADIVAKAIEGPITAQVTATAMHLFRGNMTVLLDKAAASKLQYVDHYLHVEKAMRQLHSRN